MRCEEFLQALSAVHQTLLPLPDYRTIATFCARMSQTARATGVIFLVNEKTRSGL
jgi:hypothetical protein